MVELLNIVWSALQGALTLCWDAVYLVLLLAWSLATWLHVSSPRLEGLLVGVVLAWLLLRRDKHPLLRVLSSPLKLVVDILDLAWDQVVEVARDVWDVVVSWVGKVLGLCQGIVVGTWNKLMSGLRSVRDGLSKSQEQRNEDH